MTIVAWKEAQPHATLTSSLGGKREWSAPYILTSDNPRDDAKTCVDFMESIGRGLRMTFRYGDREDSSVWCKQISPTRRANSAIHWDVVCVYSPPQYPSQKPGVDVEGKPVEDPLEWRYDISLTNSSFQVPVEKAWNVDVMPVGGTGGGYKRSVDTIGPVHNSAGVIYDPTLMRNVPELIVRISGNLAHVNSSEFLAVLNCINKQPISWHPTLLEHYDFTAATFDSYTVLCTGASAVCRWENDVSFWQHTYEFALRMRATSEGSYQNPQDGFLETILDRGITRIANPGAADGAGGTYTTGDFKAGMAEATAIRDIEGERVPEMVLLDGHGQPLRGSDTWQAPPVYFRWRVHPFAYFPALPLQIWKA